MKAEYVNPFFKATSEVFKLMLDLEIDKGSIEGAKDRQEKEVSVYIEITGDLKGTITYRFPESMILEMVKIMSGMEFDQIDSFVTSALGEVSNIISGNATANLVAHNYHCDIRPPKIVTDQVSGDGEGKPVLTIPLQTVIGNMQVDISLEENK